MTLYVYLRNLRQLTRLARQFSLTIVEFSVLLQWNIAEFSKTQIGPVEVGL